MFTLKLIKTRKQNTAGHWDAIGQITWAWLLLLLLETKQKPQTGGRLPECPGGAGRCVSEDLTARAEDSSKPEAHASSQQATAAVALYCQYSFPSMRRSTSNDSYSSG